MVAMDGCDECFRCNCFFEAFAPIRFYLIVVASLLGPTAPPFKVTPGELLTSANEVETFPDIAGAIILFLGELALKSLILVRSVLISLPAPAGDCEFRK